MEAQYKMVITVDVDTGTIEKVERIITSQSEIIKLGNKLPLSPPGGYRHIGTLLAFTGSQCVTLAIPGGGSYTICH